MRVCTQHKHNENTAENGADECQSTRHRSIHTPCALFADVRLKWGSMRLLHWCVGRLVAVSAGCACALEGFVSRQSVAIARDAVDAASLWCAGLVLQPEGSHAASPSWLHGALTHHAAGGMIAVEPEAGVAAAERPRVAYRPSFVRVHSGGQQLPLFFCPPLLSFPTPHAARPPGTAHLFSTHTQRPAHSTRGQTGRTHAVSPSAVP
jgi:hypothetical protein